MVAAGIEYEATSSLTFQPRLSQSDFNQSHLTGSIPPLHESGRFAVLETRGRFASTAQQQVQSKTAAVQPGPVRLQA